MMRGLCFSPSVLISDFFFFLRVFSGGFSPFVDGWQQRERDKETQGERE